MVASRNGTSARQVAVAAAFAAAVVWSGGAAAQAAERPNYDYLDIEYATGNYDDGEIEYDVRGGEIRASAQAFDHFFVTGSYSYGKLDLKGFDDGLDTRDYSVGVGAFLPVLGGEGSAVAMDIAGSVSYLRSDLEHSTDSGWKASVGPRVRIGSRWEIDGTANYFDVGDDSAWTFGVKGHWEATHLIALSAGVEVDEHSDEVIYTVGTRLNLGDE